ncbi:chemotaxis protein CheW [Achromobacter ruhlandii]|uniref:chemotaxis protein CheW n=1 Tax=Achromobacter ruhlandii TaxID=72557 RepID=UPI003211B645
MRARGGGAHWRGTGAVWVALGGRGGLDAPVAGAGRERPAAARMLIFGGAGRAVVLPVDEVEGIHSVDLEALEALPATLEGASLKYSRGVARCGQRSVGVLDETLLMQALERSLA